MHYKYGTHPNPLVFNDIYNENFNFYKNAVKKIP